MIDKISVPGLKNPIVFFIAVTFGFSYLIGMPYNIWLSQAELNLPPILSIYLSRLLIVIGPAVGAVLTAFIFYGRQGLSDLLQKLNPRKGQLIWYIILPILCFSLTGTAYLIAGLQWSRLFEILTSSWLTLLIHWLIQCFIIGVGEELGWRIWLLPQLNTKFNLLKSILLTILIWGLWHFPILFYGLDIVMPWLLILIASSIILTYLWIRAKESVFLFAVAHGSINTLQFFLENQLDENESRLIISAWEINGYFYFIIGLLLLIAMKNILFEKVPSQRISL